MLKLLATDLDGTIYTRANKFNSADLETLLRLGEQNICRVIATGRTFQSALSVIPANFPIDYLVFSSGAGIYDWNNKSMLKIINMGYNYALQVIQVLNDFNVEYTVHHPIPDNHIFFHSVSSDPHPDFERYLEFNRANAIPEEKTLPREEYSQLLAFLPDMELFREIETHISGLKVVRATSPIDGRSIWMEFFDHRVSKANGVDWICRRLNIESPEVVVIGNDYNDLDMLRSYKNSFIVDNAPETLKNEFTRLSEVSRAPLQDWQQRYSGLTF